LTYRQKALSSLWCLEPFKKRTDAFLQRVLQLILSEYIEEIAETGDIWNVHSGAALNKCNSIDVLSTAGFACRKEATRETQTIVPFSFAQRIVTQWNVRRFIHHARQLRFRN
jgi:hypothetical protein